MNANPAPIRNCSCGNPRPYTECCGRFHAGAWAESAQQLLRSRYSAYERWLEDYLLETWHPSTRPPELSLADSYGTRWLGLDIRSRHQAGDIAWIEFIARFRVGQGPAQQQNEISRFVREEGRWYYLDGEFPLPRSKLLGVGRR